MKTTLSALVTLGALWVGLLSGLAACDRKPSPTPPKPTTTAGSAGSAGPLAPAAVAPPPSAR